MESSNRTVEEVEIKHDPDQSIFKQIGWNCNLYLWTSLLVYLLQIPPLFLWKLMQKEVLYSTIMSAFKYIVEIHA